MWPQPPASIVWALPALFNTALCNICTHVVRTTCIHWLCSRYHACAINDQAAPPLPPAED
jgi:hypothetical protein